MEQKEVGAEKDRKLSSDPKERENQAKFNKAKFCQNKLSLRENMLQRILNSKNRVWGAEPQFE